MKTKELVKKVLEHATSNKSGFTLNIKTLEPIQSGYVASYKATQNSFSATDLQSVITHAIRHEGIVGGWYNTKDKKYYFDSNKVFNNIVEAIEFGMDNEQIAIFDLNNNKPIGLNTESKEFDFSTFAEWMLNTANQVVKHYKGDILIDAKKIVELRNNCLYSSQSDKPQGFSLYWGVRECGTWIYHIEGDNGFTLDQYMKGLGAEQVFYITFWFDKTKNEIITVNEINPEEL